MLVFGVDRGHPAAGRLDRPRDRRLRRLPDLATVGTFAVLFLTLPAFYIALTVGLGTAIKSTAGVAGIAFAVMFLPQVIGGLAADRHRAVADVDRDLGDGGRARASRRRC